MARRDMQNAPGLLDPSSPGLSLNEAIRVNKAANKSWVGSCNACTNGQYTLNDKNEPLVTNVDLRGMSFRLCERCRAQLKAML